ncbi:hypothetical protein MLD38_013368 [Melastoma candidum]|uniref:Uncharacterized protein n=1 Tax=Melastoma candidum TaxID=119954 RepID=A0ACB9R9B2_9MYRT|nr:hypothetical protein MLD38_013368 [Melastoma candidum]
MSRGPPSVPYKKPPVRYRECLKNHAASMGGNATDGCGEFMPIGEEGTIEALPALPAAATGTSTGRSWKGSLQWTP